ncbi:MAG: MFS transporter, partial [Chloroflexota bacterium]
MSREPAPLASLAAFAGYRWLVVGTVCIGAFLGQLDASIATLVLPTLEQVFQAPTAAVEWVAISYLLTLAGLVVIFGRLADMAGRKLLYNAGFLVFIAGSALCGMASGLGSLIVFRVFQAVGAAMLQSNSVAIITAAVPRRELGRAIGVQGAAQAVGLSIGPSVGGFLIAAFGWQWVFYISVPFGLLGTVVAWFVLPRTERFDKGAKQRFDWLGAVILTTAIALALFALTFGNSWGWASPRLLAAVVASALALAIFGWIERRAKFPLLDFQLFRSRVFSAGILSGLFSYAVLFGALFLLPFYLQRILQHDPAGTGLLLTVIPVAIAILAPVSGLLADRIGTRLPTVLGMAIAAGALLALTLKAGLSTGQLVAVCALFGVGLGLFTPANN